MKITKSELLKRENKWLQSEILKSLTNNYWDKVDKSKEDLEITINVNGIELEPKFLIDLFNNIEKYVDREAKNILEDKYQEAKNKAWELTQMINNVSANIISKFDVD
ncbi:MAG: hypothetical protein GY849_17505 [Deltaproteobacteria bacterium]|nr:hypothetical protein [Deltaproteobacteria bacterium]